MTTLLVDRRPARPWSVPTDPQGYGRLGRGPPATAFDETLAMHMMAQRSTVGRSGTPRQRRAGSACVAIGWLVLIAASPVERARAANKVKEAPITASDLEHWAFQPITRPHVPAAPNRGWARRAIDRFVLARLRQRGLRPQPPADKATLIRRLTIDLTGLPPSPDEVDRFVADSAPDAYEQQVSRLLASPAFGERQAQFWLDLARWAETDGFEFDKPRPQAWKYRDWVIQALNRDLPYDDFVSMQLAGDLLYAGDEWARTATGFCLAGPDMPDINLEAERRANVLNELTGAVGGVFLGLQMACAQCHAHKYDPISQHDFYRLRAVFEPSVNWKGHVFSGESESKGPSYLYLRGDFRQPGPRVRPGFPRIANPRGNFVLRATGSADPVQRRAALARWLARPDHPLCSRVIVNRIWQRHFGRGLCETPSDFGVMGDRPRFAPLLDWIARELITGRWSRKRLHRWIVTSATYRQASRPMPDGESTWQRAVTGDPANRFWSRYPRRRMTGEAIRDAMLSAAGLLQRRQYGESARPPLPAEVARTLLRPDHWEPSPRTADHYRRSVYLFARRNLRYPMFEAFDRPSATRSCAIRQRSTTAPQALLLLNSRLSLCAARHLAGRVMRWSPSDQIARVRHCFRLALSRSPTVQESEAALEFLRGAGRSSGPRRRAAPPARRPMVPTGSHEGSTVSPLALLCLALFNSNEFVYLE